MIFGVARLVSFICRFMSLHPGDIISTGTPPGIGMGQKPEPVYLRAGNHVRLGIEGLGEQSQSGDVRISGSKIFEDFAPRRSCQRGPRRRTRDVFPTRTYRARGLAFDSAPSRATGAS